MTAEHHDHTTTSRTHRPAIVAVTRHGAVLANRLAGAMTEADVWVSSRFAGFAGHGAHAFDGPVARLVGDLMARHDRLVMICAVGAAVRLIAPHLVDKRADAAVVAVDDGGQFAVCVLSGHIGGGNALTREVADALGAAPVITTASEAHGVPAADLIGRELGWRIEGRHHLTRLAAALVNGEPVGVFQDAGERDWHAGPLPEHVIHFASVEHLLAASPRAAIVITDRVIAGLAGRAGVVVYRPRSLVVGVGCSRGASCDEIGRLVDATLRDAGLSVVSVRAVATVELKRDEPGLVAFARERDIPLRCFSAEQLNAAPGQETPSEVVRAAVGTRGVCEPAALLTAGAGRLLVPKRKSRNVTVAVARTALPFAAASPDDLPVAAGSSTTRAMTGILHVVGIGPGAPEQMTGRAREVLEAADAIVGYGLYLDLLRVWLPHARYHPSPIGDEEARAREALLLTKQLTRVALVGSGDAGIYGLAGLAHEVRDGIDWADQMPPAIDVVPGVTAATAVAALLGAPLGHDFATVSLSDILTPWDTIAGRLEAAAVSDFVLALYNPTSQRRGPRFAAALDILRRVRSPETPVGIVTNAYRDGQSVIITSLGSVEQHPVSMLTTLIIGNSRTRVQHGRMVTPRGYTVNG